MNHTCHWPKCKSSVLPKFWGCRRHWFMLPKEIRDGIWRHYRPGQEIDKRISAEYIYAIVAARSYACAA